MECCCYILQQLQEDDDKKALPLISADYREEEEEDDYEKVSQPERLWEAEGLGDTAAGEKEREKRIQTDRQTNRQTEV